MIDDLNDLRNEMDDPRESFPEDAAFDRWIAEVAPTINAPNATPRADIWQSVESARAAARAANTGRNPGVTPIRRPPWRLMTMIAAALLLGVALDRVLLRARGSDGGPGPRVASERERIPADSPSARLYHVAASHTLTQAEALLTAYRANAARDRAAAGTEELGRWGREVLSSTRLLLDSPAGNDPRLRALLEDVELVLVQLIQLASDPADAADHEHVEQALEKSDLIPRIRTAVPGDVAVTAGE